MNATQELKLYVTRYTYGQEKQYNNRSMCMHMCMCVCECVCCDKNSFKSHDKVDTLLKLTHIKRKYYI